MSRIKSSLIMISVEIFFAGTAILVSLISLYITMINRRNSLREKIFSEQIEISKKLYHSTSVLENILDDILICDDNDEIKELRQKLNKEHDVFQEILDTESLFLDEKIENIILKQIKTINSTVIKVLKEESYTSKEYEEAFFEIQDGLHIMLGIPSLSKENRRLIRSNRY